MWSTPGQWQRTRTTVAGGVLAAVVGLGALGLAPSPAAAAAKHFTSTAKSGNALLTVTGTIKPGDLPRYRNLVVTLRSGGKVKLQRRLGGPASESWGSKPIARLADASGDGQPDAFVDVYSGGAHCCTVSTIAVSTGKGTWGKPFRETFTAGYRLRDLGAKDGTFEIVGADGRFDYLFSSHAESALPITIEHLSATGLVDVASQFPDRLRADANTWLDYWEHDGPAAGESADDAELREYGARSMLAATLADLVRIPALSEAQALAARAVARGDFAHLPAANDPQLFDTDVAHKLQELGFVSDWSVLGLPQ